jgi:quinol monooxygenase YgiN
MIYVFVSYRCKPGKRDEFYNEIRKRGIGAKSRAEEGNSRYEYFFSMEEPDSLLLAEEWKDAESLAAHAGTAHFKELQALKGEYLEKTEINRHEA